MVDEPPEGTLDATIAEPPEFGEARHSVLSPSGEYESTRDFVRGLGPRRLKTALFVGGGLVMLLTLLAALQ